MIEHNDLESKRFGIVAARVIDTDATPDAIDKAARAMGAQMLTVRVPSDDIRYVQSLEVAGWRMMDTLVYYDCVLGRSSAPVPSSVRLANAGDAAIVGRIARAAFSGYFGHYHADPRLSDIDADAVYVEWAETSIRQCGSTAPAFVAEQDAQVVGFLTTRLNGDNEGEIVLNAVHPDQQGRGIYGDLVVAATRELLSAGCRTAIVSTQINNVAVQRAWARLGFRMKSSFYTLHKWMD